MYNYEHLLMPSLYFQLKNDMSRYTYKLSPEGLNKVEKLRRLKGWGKTSREWREASVSLKSSESTLKRFLKGEAISADHFKALCRAIGIEEWQSLVDWPDMDMDGKVVLPPFLESEKTPTKTENNSSSKYGLAVTGVFSADKKLEIEAALEAIKNLLLTSQIVMKPQKED